MFHPTVKSRLIFIRRLILQTLVEIFFKILCTLFTARINNMTITFCDHLRLCVTRITLNCFDVSTSKY